MSWLARFFRSKKPEVVLSPDQELALYGPVLEKMTLDEVNTALRQLWSSPRRLVEVVGQLPADLAVRMLLKPMLLPAKVEGLIRTPISKLATRVMAY